MTQLKQYMYLGKIEIQLGFQYLERGLQGKQHVKPLQPPAALLIQRYFYTVHECGKSRS